MSPRELARQLEQIQLLRQHGGYCVVFTNGCFDVLHPGHIDLLEYAAWHLPRRATGGRQVKLVVGLNGDRSIRQLKGPGRPVNRWRDRARVLLALRAVDFVLPFYDPTPLALIKELRPDVLIKGGDYKSLCSIVGAEFVRKTGGRVVPGPYKAGFSSTRLCKRMYKAWHAASKA